MGSKGGKIVRLVSADGKLRRVEWEYESAALHWLPWLHWLHWLHWLLALAGLHH
jgi:hypothetical protein